MAPSGALLFLSARIATCIWYSPAMRAAIHHAADDAEHDAGLVEWFLRLTPAQRLAELDSRVSFLVTTRQSHDHQQLRPDPGGIDPASR